MLILASDSTCDVCRERYNGSTIAPHVLACGHTFCLSCLATWRKGCPLCRALYEIDDARKLLIHSIVSAVVPPTPVRRSSDDMDAPPAYPSHDNSSSSDMDDEEDDEEEDDEDDEAANGYLAQITEVTLGGDRPASEVQELVAGIGEWLTHQPEDKHRDLRSAQLLLYKVVKRRGDKAKFEDMRISHDKLQSQLEDAEKSNDELQIAVEKLNRRCKDVETEVEALLIELKEARGKRIEQRTQYADLERRYEDSMHDWNLKYERCLKENREYRELLGTIRPDLLSSPPKIPRNNIYAEASVVEPQAMTTEDRRPSGSPPTSKNRQSIFALSPVPATLPMPAISSIHATFSSPAEDSDAEEIRKVTSHTPRSVQPIPIKSNGYRHGSNLRESEVPRSIPRSLVDVHMASCSSSPVVSDLKYASAERPAEAVSQSVTMHDATSPSTSRRPTVSSRRPSVSSHSSHSTQDPESQRLVWKAQLHDLLDQEPSDNEVQRPPPIQPERRPPPRTTSPPRPIVAPRRTTSPETRRSTSPDASAPVTRHPSPVSSSGVSDTVSEKERMQSSLLQRPTQGISRASTAAMQAERARQEKLSAALAPPPPIGSVYKDAGLQRDISNTYYGQQPQQQYGRPPFSRRPSDTTRGKPPTSHPTNPSALTRSLWTAESQHAQRV